MRTIKKVMPSQKVNMGGIILDQPLPQRGVNQIDPFLLVHHWIHHYEGGQKQWDVGVGPHPHRGFSPVTFIFKGGVHHRDSTGYSSIVEAGGTQWMNSGKGIVHSERPKKEIVEEGGEFEIIQFWVNAPARNKMDEPSYQPLAAEETPHFESKDKKARVSVVAGELNGVKGKINAYSDLITARIDIEKGGEIALTVPESHNAFLYQLDGTVTINNEQRSEDKTLIWFNNDGKEISIRGEVDSRLILLSGAPIKEPVATYGPFVMNNQREIIEALNDYQAGKMGVLDETFE